MIRLRFSVVIPLYNKRAYIRRAVDSVLAQTHREFELIVVDDGSTDGSHEALASVADQRCTLVRQQNAGAGAARNRGAGEARERWVSFLDADDFWLPEHLAETSRLIQAFPGCGFVATGFREVPEAEADRVRLDAGRRSNLRAVDYLLEASREIGRVNSSNVTIRRASLLAVGGFGPFPAGEDLDCWARLALREKAALSDRLTAIYVRGTGGVMQQLEELQPTIPNVSARRLEDISPSVASLCRAIEAEPALARRRGLHAYLNARVFSCVYGSLYRLDVPEARNYAKLLNPPYGVTISAFRLLLLLPPAWLTIALRAARNLNDTGKSLHG